MSRKKIAVLIDWYLPGTKAGGPVRSVYSLMSLLKGDLDFYLITTNQDLGSSTCYEQVVPDQLQEKEGIHYYYFSKEQLSQHTLLRLLKDIDPDLVYLNSFWSVHFSIQVVRAKSKGLIRAAVLLAPRGMLGKGALGIKSFKKRVFLFMVRLLGWYRSVSFHATQVQEEKDIRKKFGGLKIYVAPNINASAVVQNTSSKQAGSLRLFFLSRIDRVKNLHMAIDLLRTIPAGCTVSYDIFGNLENTDYWSECKKLIDQLPPHVTVTYKGELAFHEVQKTICQYHFLLLPTLNENYGHSIVESLLSGCPAVISDQTPWNDLEEHNAGYAIALNDKEKFVAAITGAAALDHAQFSLKSKAAIEYIRKKIDLQAVHAQYKTLFNDCIKN